MAHQLHAMTADARLVHRGDSLRLPNRERVERNAIVHDPQREAAFGQVEIVEPDARGDGPAPRSRRR